MTEVLRTQSHPAAPLVALPSLRFVDEVAELTAIFDPAVNVVCLRRPPSSVLVEEAARAAAQPAYRKLFTVAPDSASRTVPEELSGFPSLAADIGRWIEVLADLMGAEHLGVRLARLETAMCPRFHVDRVMLRAVITYQGRGTELISSEHVDRRRLGHAARGATDESSGLMLAPGRVRAAAPFDVVLLKGEAWPQNEGCGAVHRSPAASAEESRLVLTLDLL